jgi:hypothetical protein
MKIDKTFPTKIIASDLEESEVVPFIKALIECAWTDQDVPGGMRKVGCGKKLTLDMLPKTFDATVQAKNAYKRKLLNLERIGGVFIDLKLVVAQKANSKYEVNIDKFSYEKDGAILESIANQAMKMIQE